ncbi:peptidoglycan DD-metalloendopeptidase family protein [Catenovulum sp. SM1970]|uniref:peptidoglycan DD-metalloendopeptidase family protein n=1 Tax=Marinifaba aquimaris TaxID=2741323 RepID=UPI0015734210|nr:peptidoglycan DD-metalloendopeptidase family protein [Marinifaba aquimaris]NTS78055.1 peptidoglycan DD-metalloendopeptidase family protein [Marinifaba aquimaris]
MSIWRAVLLCLLAAGLSACADTPHTPAPVEKVYRGKSIHDFEKGSLKQSQYTVKKGDTLFSIAFQAGVDYQKLAKVNKITPPYILSIGQKLSLKTTKNQTVKSRSNKRKTVKSNPSNKPIKKPLEKPKIQEYRANSSQKQSGNSGRIVWQWPSKGKIIARFSNKELGNKGLDFGGNRGDKVTAAAEGKVVYAGDALRGYGKLIIIKHSDDYLSAYAHNDKIRVREQQWIKAGQHIADMGSTDTNGVKLHFEVRYRGNTLDPLKFLPKR